MLVLLAVSTAVAVWEARPRPDWKLDGPHGAFPTAVAAEAPHRPEKTVATFPYLPMIYGGVALRAVPEADAITAADLRSGRVYWTFTRRRGHLVAASVDWKRGRLLTVWARADAEAGSTSVPLRVTTLDIRKGRVAWERTIDGSGPYPSTGFWEPRVRTAAVIPFSRAVVALDPGTGRTRWQVPDPCDHTAVLLTESTVVLHHQCHGDETVDGRDAATGRLLWSRTFASWWPGRDLARKLPVKVADLGRDRVVVWTVEREAVYDARTGSAIAERPAAGKPTDTVSRGDDLVFRDGVRYGTCYLRLARGARHGICANDEVSGRTLWTSPLPGRHDWPALNPSVAVADGRVYSLSSVHGGEFADRLTVNDARTGAVLARVPLSLPSQGDLYRLAGASDGVVAFMNDMVTSLPRKYPTVLLGDR
ncbi:outer membrane protein assembly factor BamB family protein [Actinomadura logoneensis]|nr:PQQ-binding-like beta-propeller repeat protein [Actinomadura logoneensis]